MISKMYSYLDKKKQDMHDKKQRMYTQRLSAYNLRMNTEKTSYFKDLIITLPYMERLSLNVIVPNITIISHVVP